MTIKRFTLISFGLIALIGCGESSSSDSSESSNNPLPTSEAVETSTPKTTLATPTTVKATTTTIDPGSEGDLGIILAVTAIEQTRSDLISAIESDNILERVDVLEVEVVNGAPGEPGEVILHVEGSSGYSTNEYQLEQTWELFTQLSFFWETGGTLRNDLGTLKPSFEAVVDGRKFLADYDLMVRVDDRRVTKDEFFALATL